MVLIARCVSHKGKTLVVYHKGTVNFACGIFSHKALSSISRTLVVFCNLSLWEKRLANYSNNLNLCKLIRPVLRSRTNALARVMRVAMPIPAVASASVFHSAAGGGSVVDVVRPL